MTHKELKILMIEDAAEEIGLIDRASRKQRVLFEGYGDDTKETSLIRIPFILVTGAAFEGSAVMRLKEGADHYVLKLILAGFLRHFSMGSCNRNLSCTECRLNIHQRFFRNTETTIKLN